MKSYCPTCGFIDTKTCADCFPLGTPAARLAKAGLSLMALAVICGMIVAPFLFEPNEIKAFGEALKPLGVLLLMFAVPVGILALSVTLNSRNVRLK